MEKMSLWDIQKLSLNILLDVHHFCMNNGIRYSLAYGTLIGAIRHQGFIPWDDDIDIFMPRPDYKRFCDLYQSEEYTLISSYDRNSYLAYSRVCDLNQTYAEEFVPWSNLDTGIWIDIFPLDGAEDEKNKFDIRYKKANYLWKLIYRERGAKRKFTCDLTTLQRFKLIIKKIIYINGFFLEKHLRIFKALIEQYPFRECRYWGQLTCCDNGSNEYNLTSVFDEFILAKFEGHEFCVVKDYDSVLRSQYGNYMELPPVEDRVPKQTDISFYWKK